MKLVYYLKYFNFNFISIRFLFIELTLKHVLDKIRLIRSSVKRKKLFDAVDYDTLYVYAANVSGCFSIFLASMNSKEEEVSKILLFISWNFIFKSQKLNNTKRRLAKVCKARRDLSNHSTLLI